MSLEECADGADLCWIDKKVFLPHDCESNIVLLNFHYGVFQYMYSSLTILLNEHNQYLENVKISIEICSDWVMKCNKFLTIQ